METKEALLAAQASFISECTEYMTGDVAVSESYEIPDLPDVLYVDRRTENSTNCFLSRKTAYCCLFFGFIGVWRMIVDLCCIKTVIYTNKKVFSKQPESSEIVEHLEQQRKERVFEI